MTSATKEAITHPDLDEIQLPDVLAALSDPVRLRMVAALAEGERTCGSIEVPVAKSTVTHHIRVLREAGLIYQRQEGTARVTGLRSEDLERRFPGLLETVLAAA
jgi:DNA-binding transcriptional ArsR family regulator